MIGTNNAFKDILCNSKIIFISGKHSFHHSHHLRLPPVTSAASNTRNLHGIICRWIILYNKFVGQWSTRLNYQRTTILKITESHQKGTVYKLNILYGWSYKKTWYSDPDFRKTHLWWHSFYFTKHHIGDRVSTRKIVLSLKSWLLYTPSKLNEFKVQYPSKKHRKMWSALKFLLNTYTSQSRHFACLILLKSSEFWQYFGETVSISTTQWLYGCFSPPNLTRKYITHTRTTYL